MAQAGPSRPPLRSKHTRRNAVIVVALFLIGGLALVTVPIPRTSTTNFSITDPGSLSQDYHQLEVLSPVGATASVSFSSQDGGVVVFQLIDPFQTTLWSEKASSGSTSFTIQTAGGYEFSIYAPQPENVTVRLSITTSAPVL